MKIFLSCLGLLAALCFGGCCMVGAGGLAYYAYTQNLVQQQVEPVAPQVTPPVTPTPTPSAEPKPDKKRPRWDTDGCRSVGTASYEQMPFTPQQGGLTHDGPTHDGQEVQIDIPADLLKRNITSQGQGCCGYRSANYIGIFNNIPSLIDFPEKLKQAGIPGGSNPELYDRTMKKLAPDFKYIHVVNGDWNLVKQALKMGRCVSITWIPGHVVCIVKLENGVGCLRDNNQTGPSELVWGSEEAIKQKCGGQRFWAVIPLHGRPPAPPRHGKQSLGFSEHRVRVKMPSRLAPERLPGRYSWDEVIDNEQWLLYHDGRQVGAFVPKWDCYQERLAAGQWKTWRRPPVSPPADAMAALQDMPPGVRFEELGQRERYSLCGQEITREQAQAALEDDSAKLSLTAIGGKEETARVRADLDRPEMSQFKSHVIFQEYTPDNWAISTQRYGFDTSGHPTVYLQKPDGEVLWHTNQYDGVPTMEGLRKQDPGYRPANDPGMPHLPSLIGGSQWGLPSLLFCVACLLLFGFAMVSAVVAIPAFLAHLVGEFIEPIA